MNATRAFQGFTLSTSVVARVRALTTELKENPDLLKRFGIVPPQAKMDAAQFAARMDQHGLVAEDYVELRRLADLSASTRDGDAVISSACMHPNSSIRRECTQFIRRALQHNNRLRRQAGGEVSNLYGRAVNYSRVVEALIIKGLESVDEPVVSAKQVKQAEEHTPTLAEISRIRDFDQRFAAHAKRSASLGHDVGQTKDKLSKRRRSKTPAA